MPRRNNPWPAYVDLFSALMIATLGGMALLAAAYRDIENQNARVNAVRQQATRIGTRLDEAMKRNGGTFQSVLRTCGDDTCIDLYIHFDKNEDTISNAEEHERLTAFCSAMKEAIDSEFSLEERKAVEIVVEGHADRSQIRNDTDERTRFLYNWVLSSRRAAAVLYEFGRVGVQVPAYDIVAIGYADSQPLCNDPSDECLSRNRRTTLRLRVDTKRLEEMMKSLQQASGSLR